MLVPMVFIPSYPLKAFITTRKAQNKMGPPTGLQNTHDYFHETINCLVKNVKKDVHPCYSKSKVMSLNALSVQQTNIFPLIYNKAEKSLNRQFYTQICHDFTLLGCLNHVGLFLTLRTTPSEAGTAIVGFFDRSFNITTSGYLDQTSEPQWCFSGVGKHR